MTKLYAAFNIKQGILLEPGWTTKHDIVFEEAFEHCERTKDDVEIRTIEIQPHQIPQTVFYTNAWNPETGDVEEK